MIEILCGFEDWAADHCTENEVRLARMAYRAGVLAGIRFDVMADLQPLINYLHDEIYRKGDKCAT